MKVASFRLAGGFVQNRGRMGIYCLCAAVLRPHCLINTMHSDKSNIERNLKINPIPAFNSCWLYQK
jgi:hypothetical protein